MSYFDDASLVMIPSGYKTSKVYSVKPTSGDGDLTFTRSNDTATRVGPDGLIEKVRTNLLLQSNSFDTTWTNVNTTETGGQAGYDGTSNAWLISATGASAGILQNISQSGMVTQSVYAKAGTSNWMMLRLTDGTTNNLTYVDLTNRVFGNTGTNFVRGTITDVGGGWSRVSVTINQASYNSLYFYIAKANADLSTTNETIFIQNAQLETGDIATEPILTTTAAVSVGPVANVPRLDYLNSSCPRLLLEPQRTNSLTYSEQINNAAWGKLNVTVSANQAVAPDGTTSADLVYPTTTGADRLIEQLPVAVIGQTWTSSLFVKASGFTWVLMYSPNLVPCWFNASTGVFGTVGAGATASVLGQVNGYWRISLTGTVASSNAYLYAGPANANGTTTATANGTNGLLFWGCQVEQGAYATSYIPTLGAAVTRGADAASKTGISSLIGQTEGTLFLEIDLRNLRIANTYIFIRNAAVTGYIGLRITDAALRFEVANTSIQVGINFPISTTGVFKLGMAYKENDFAFYVNGTQVGVDTLGTVPACDILDLNYAGPSLNAFGIAQAILFPTRLSNSDLAALTA